MIQGFRGPSRDKSWLLKLIELYQCSSASGLIRETESKWWSLVGRAQWDNLWFILHHPHRNVLMRVEKWQTSEVESRNILLGRAESEGHRIKASFQPYSQKEALQLVKGSALHLFCKTAGADASQPLLACCHLFPHKAGIKHQRWLVSSPYRNTYYLQHLITPGQGLRDTVRGVNPTIQQQGPPDVELNEWPRSATSWIRSTLLFSWELTGF